MTKKKTPSKNDSEVVTRKILREELRGFATKADLKRELALYATKDDLANSEDKMLTEMRVMFKDFTDFVVDKNREFKDEILTAIDKVMGDNERLTTENEVGTHQIRNLRVKVDNHEKRLKALEAV